MKKRNNVELEGWYGSDETHARSAWTSTKRDVTEEKRGRIPSLIEMLISHLHHTPFEKSYMNFVISVDNPTHIQLLKHRIGVAINAQSARYGVLNERNYYVPQDWPAELQQRLEDHAEQAFDLYEETYKLLCTYYESEGMKPADAKKRAKESARYFLPQNLQVKLDIAFNWRSFLHFLGLRYNKHAQLEIREVAAEMLRLIEETGDFPHTIRAVKAYLKALALLPDLVKQFLDPNYVDPGETNE
jgi:thymidylate synthase (FAD)